MRELMAVLALRRRAAGSGAARCGARASAGWRSESPVSAPSVCSRAGSIQAAWARPRSGNPQTFASTPHPQALSAPDSQSPPRVATLLGTPPGTRGGRCSCCLAAPRAVRVPGRLHLSAPAPPELKLSLRQLRLPRPQIREGDCRISSWVGVLWLFERGRSKRADLSKEDTLDVHGPLGCIINNQHLRTAVNWSSRERTFLP